MRHTFLLAFAIFIGFISCDTFNDPESPYEEKIVIFGNISGDLPMIDDTIFVSRSASLDEKIDAEINKIVDKVGAGDAMLAIVSCCLKVGLDSNLSLLMGSIAAGQSVESMGNSASVNRLQLLKTLKHMAK